MEVFFKGRLEAGLADEGVHVILVGFFQYFPLGGGHGTHGTQHVGGVLGVVFPDGGGLNEQARNVQLQDVRQVLRGHVLDENKVGQIGQTAAQTQLVVDADDGTGLFIGPFLGDLKADPELFQQQRRGDIRVQIASVLQKLLEVTLPGGIVLVQGVLEGPGLGDREPVGIFDAPFLAEVHQPVQVLVGGLGGQEDEVVENQVVTGSVAHQNDTVPVQDIAPGGLHTGQGLKVGGIIGITVGLDDLQGVQPQGVEAQGDDKQDQQDRGTKSGYSFHGSPPIFAMALTRGYSGSITATVRRPVITK